MLRTSEIIDKLVDIDRDKKSLAETEKVYKAELQKRGLRYIEDKNLKQKIFLGSDSNRAEFTQTQKLEVINWFAFKEVVGSLADEKVQRLISYDYKWDSRFEEAIKAIFTKDYNSEVSLSDVLKECFKADSSQIDLLIKKLKGDYKKDKEQLIAVLKLPADEDLDVELDYIHKIINWSKIKMFIPDDTERIIEAIKKCIIVTQTPKLAIKYGDVNE
jgi:hypothetical protein